MIKRLLVLLLFAIPALAQTPAVVTGLVFDSGGTPAIRGTVQFDIQPQVQGVQYFIQGIGTVAPQTVICGIDGTGHVMNATVLTNPCTVWGNDLINPANTTYTVTFNPNGQSTNSVAGECIAGSTYNLNSPIFCPIVQIVPQQAIISTSPTTTNIIPNANKVYNIGSPQAQFAAIYAGNIFGNLSGSLPALVFADQFVNVQAAITACPTNGCIIYATSPTVNLALGTIDAGNKFVTLLLGPYVYTLTQLTLETNFHMFGTGSGASGGTVIQSTSTTIPMVVLPAAPPTGIGGVQLGGFRLYCGATNTNQIAIDIVAPPFSGLWYSKFDDIDVGGDGTHACAGNSLRLEANNNTGVNQFLTISNFWAFRTTGGAPALLATGLNGQVSMFNTQWDGPTPHDLGFINAQIDDGTETILGPYTWMITNFTSQHAWGATGTGLVIKGCSNCTVIDGHFEDDNGGITLAVGNHFGNTDVHIMDNVFTTNTGINPPGNTGWILQADATSRADFQDNVVRGTPDACLLGAVTLVTARGTMNQANGLPDPLCDNFGVATQRFTANGTFTIPGIVNKLKVTVCGGGGAGGGSTAGNNGSGGAAGGCTYQWLATVFPGNTLTVTVGNGGTGASGTTGGAGGSSSVASGTQVITTITGLGGAGGFCVGATSAGAGQTAAGVTGLINAGGGGGSIGTGGAGGTGASSPYGGGGGGAGSGGFSGNAAVGFAAGGGGSSSGASTAGGNGSGGLVIFEWVN
jgi:hypothetical protein